MIIIDTVDFIIHVYCKWHPIETLVTNAAPKATRMIWFSHSLKNLQIRDLRTRMMIVMPTNAELKMKRTNCFHYKMTTERAAFRSLLKSAIEIILFTVHLAIDIIKCFAS